MSGDNKATTGLIAKLDKKRKRQAEEPSKKSKPDAPKSKDSTTEGPQNKKQKSGKNKGKKDKNAPKRPLSAYMFFSQDWRERVKAENPDASFGEFIDYMRPVVVAILSSSHCTTYCSTYSTRPIRYPTTRHVRCRARRRTIS